MLATYSLGGKLIFALSCIHPRDWYCNQELSFLLMYWKEKGKSVCKCYPRAKFNIRPEFQALAFKRTDNETLEFLQTHNVNSPLNSSGYDVFILNLSWIIKQTTCTTWEVKNHKNNKPCPPFFSGASFDLLGASAQMPCEPRASLGVTDHLAYSAFTGTTGKQSFSILFLTELLLGTPWPS